MQLTELQQEVKNWLNRNFKARDAYHSLIGVVEELGELAHAHLKQIQGIRGTPEQHIADAQDAVGDILIYLVGYCVDRNFDLQEIIHKTWKKVKRRDWLRHRLSGEKENNACSVCKSSCTEYTLCRSAVNTEMKIIICNQCIDKLILQSNIS